MQDKSQEIEKLRDLTSHIVAAYLAQHCVQEDRLGPLIHTVYVAFRDLGNEVTADASAEPQRRPAVPIDASVHPHRLVCLECGDGFTSMKRHLSTSHNLTPEQYRARWGLAPDYPMVAPAYSERRSKMARDAGLGRKG